MFGAKLKISAALSCWKHLSQGKPVRWNYLVVCFSSQNPKSASRRALSLARLSHQSLYTLPGRKVFSLLFAALRKNTLYYKTSISKLLTAESKGQRLLVSEPSATSQEADFSNCFTKHCQKSEAREIKKRVDSILQTEMGQKVMMNNTNCAQ